MWYNFSLEWTQANEISTYRSKSLSVIYDPIIIALIQGVDVPQADYYLKYLCIE